MKIHLFQNYWTKKSAHVPSWKPSMFVFGSSHSVLREGPTIGKEKITNGNVESWNIIYILSIYIYIFSIYKYNIYIYIPPGLPNTLSVGFEPRFTPPPLGVLSHLLPPKVWLEDFGKTRDLSIHIYIYMVPPQGRFELMGRWSSY